MVRSRYCPETVESALAAIRHTGSDRAGWESAGIGKATFYEWCKKHPDFAAGVTREKVIPILETITTNRVDYYLSRGREKMAGVCQIEITETEAELKKRLSQEKTGAGKERLQLLYLLKTKKAKTVTGAAVLLGKNRVTVQDWLAKYRQGGLEKFLDKKVGGGRPRKIPLWAEKALEKRLHSNQGFNSYGEICQWLSEDLGVVANYKTVHQLVDYKLKVSPKIARPKSQEQSESRLENFKKTL